MAVYLGSPRRGSSTRNEKKFRIGLLGLLLAIAALKLSMTGILKKNPLKSEAFKRGGETVD